VHGLSILKSKQTYGLILGLEEEEEEE